MKLFRWRVELRPSVDELNRRADEMLYEVDPDLAVELGYVPPPPRKTSIPTTMGQRQIQMALGHLPTCTCDLGQRIADGRATAPPSALASLFDPNALNRQAPPNSNPYAARGPFGEPIVGALGGALCGIGRYFGPPI